MPGRTRIAIQRRKPPASPRHQRKSKNACLGKCANWNPYKVRRVNPSKVCMTADDLSWADLHNAGRLLWCSACGLVWERYHDDFGPCENRLGTFKPWKLPHIFVRDTSLG